MLLLHEHRTVASEREIAYEHRTAHGALRDADVQIRMSDAIRDSNATDSDVRCNISTNAPSTAISHFARRYHHNMV